VQHHLVI
jgi:hypothetical protein